VTATTNPGVAAYAQGGIISALQALVKDLGNSQVISNSGSSGLSSQVLSNLNSAFEKLLGDLGGDSSSAGSSASSTGSSTATAGSTASGSATASTQSTAALQSFLTNFVQDLQNNGADAVSPLGSSVDTNA
jgi:hypothetical protein